MTPLEPLRVSPGGSAPEVWVKPETAAEVAK